MSLLLFKAKKDLTEQFCGLPIWLEIIKTGKNYVQYDSVYENHYTFVYYRCVKLSKKVWKYTQTFSKEVNGNYYSICGTYFKNILYCFCKKFFSKIIVSKQNTI